MTKMSLASLPSTQNHTSCKSNFSIASLLDSKQDSDIHVDRDGSRTELSRESSHPNASRSTSVTIESPAKHTSGSVALFTTTAGNLDSLITNTNITNTTVQTPAAAAAALSFTLSNFPFPPNLLTTGGGLNQANLMEPIYRTDAINSANNMTVNTSTATASSILQAYPWAAWATLHSLTSGRGSSTPTLPNMFMPSASVLPNFTLDGRLSEWGEYGVIFINFYYLMSTSSIL